MPSKYVNLNRGEWSEVYALASILSTGILDIRQSRVGEKQRRLEVLSVSRRKAEAGDELSVFRVIDDTVLCEDSGKFISRQVLRDLVPKFLDEICSGRGAFQSSIGSKILDGFEIVNPRIGGQKADISIDVVDPLAGATGTQGYTIKSYLGSAPTLLNASGQTNFRYLVSPRLSISEEKNLNDLPVKKLVAQLCTDDCLIQWDSAPALMTENLRLLDDKMPMILGNLVLVYYSGLAGSSVAGLTDRLGTLNPLGIKHPEIYYEIKIKDALEAFALGMTPGTPWDGLRRASGGLLVVERSGEVKSIPLGERDSYREFLFRNTKLETPARGRHGFGHVVDGELKLNLQVRFL